MAMVCLIPAWNESGEQEAFWLALEEQLHKVDRCGPRPLPYILEAARIDVDTFSPLQSSISEFCV